MSDETTQKFENITELRAATSAAMEELAAAQAEELRTARAFNAARAVAADAERKFTGLYRKVMRSAVDGLDRKDPTYDERCEVQSAAEEARGVGL